MPLVPEPGRTEPRLWVRRLVIWRKPGNIIRDVSLRPGLNVVWSPDPMDVKKAQRKEGDIGHGSGKTLFCRLLRYCLGEDRFAPEGLRQRIAIALEDGYVGAEVMLDGSMWAIVRPIGQRRRHVAVPGGDIEELVADDGNSTGMAPFLAALEKVLLPLDAASLVMPGAAKNAWQVALAFLARDQECRFDHVLDWRAAQSSSDSPVRHLARLQQLSSLRALLKAITPKEMKLAAEAAVTDEVQKRAQQDVFHANWAGERLRSELLSNLNLAPAMVPPDLMGIKVMKDAADALLAQALSGQSKSIGSASGGARAKYEKVRDQIEELASEQRHLETAIDYSSRLLTAKRAELPGVSFQQSQAQDPVCPVCEVPVDRVLAEGCKLSHNLPDLESIRQRVELLGEEIKSQEAQLDDKRRELPLVEQQLAKVRSQAEDLRKQIQAIEKAQEARSKKLRQAEQLVESVRQLESLLKAKDDSTKLVERAEKEIEGLRGETAEHRRKHDKVIRRLAEIFDSIVVQLLGKEAKGSVGLSANSLELTIELGGDRSTAAIESLKVLAFDLAVLQMSMEGATLLPAFSVHDSPREADLASTIYERLFAISKDLEHVGKKPLFQYIVTTTTAPPDDVRKAPWLCLTLHGSPPRERLLGLDL